MFSQICCGRGQFGDDDLYVVELDAETTTIFSKNVEEASVIKKFSSIMLALLFILFSVSLLAAILLMVWVLIPDWKGASAEVCTSKECVATSYLMRKTMDLSVDPCDDFYQFVCGNFQNYVNVKNTAYLDYTTLTRQKTLRALAEVFVDASSEKETEAVTQMKIFYDSCLTHRPNVSSVHLLRGIIEDFVRPNETFGATVARIRRRTGQSYIVGLSVGTDYINTSQHRIFVDQPKLIIPKAILLASTRDQFAKGLFTTMTKIWQVVYPDFPRSEIEETIRQILELETEIAREMTDEDERTKPGMFNLVTLDGINDLFMKRQELEDPHLDNQITKSELKLNWVEYTQRVFAHISEIDGNTVVDVMDAQYILGLAGILARTSVKRLRNYVRWQLLYTFANDILQDTSMDEVLAVVKNNHNPNKLTKSWGREMQCIQLMDSLLPFALSYNYIKDRSPDSIIEQAEHILKDIVLSFQEVVQQSTWMEEGTKLKAIKKAGSVRAFLGYPKWSRSGVELDRYYRDLQFQEGDFVHNTLVALKWVSEKDLRDLNAPVATNWSGTSDSPAEVDAFYDDELNSITIPLGFLQQPFVGLGLKSLDYGALGFFIGHELTHGFDTEGRYSDEEGRLSSWWTPQTLENFNEKTLCIQQQYDHYFVSEVNASINGKQTLKENIADNGGLELAFRAFHLHKDNHGYANMTLPGLEQFDSDQLLFLSFAQAWCAYVSPSTLLDMLRSNEHSPPKYRVWGSVSNFEQFSKVWHCPKNSPMNPENKCVLW